MFFTMTEKVPTGFLTADKQLPFARHVFGTKSDTGRDTSHTIRITTERLGPIAHMKQVHEARIAYAKTSGEHVECDAIYTDKEDLWLAVKTADCVPVLISSPDAVAAVHCGWRGLEKELLPKTLELLMDKYNLSPLDLSIHIGPCIAQENYEVPAHFTELFGAKFTLPAKSKGKVMLDLGAIAKAQAISLGVPDLNIHALNRCTFNEAETFHSYRRHQQSGKKGAKTSDYGVQLSLIKRDVGF